MSLQFYVDSPAYRITLCCDKQPRRLLRITDTDTNISRRARGVVIALINYHLRIGQASGDNDVTLVDYTPAMFEPTAATAFRAVWRHGDRRISCGVPVALRGKQRIWR